MCKNVEMQRVNLLRWNFTNKCNYRCSYCITFPVRNLNAEKSIPALKFVNRFSQIISGKWNISLEGLGEPFCSPEFFDIVRELANRGFYVSVTTNFSSPYSDIDKFIQATNGNLLRMGVSLHLEYVNWKSFLDKVFHFNKIIPGKICVKYVATRKGVALLDRIANSLRLNNVSFLVNAERIKTNSGLGYSRYYSLSELNKIKLCTSTFWQDLSFVGKLCWTGCGTFVVQEDGSAYRCAPARTHDAKRCIMGNIFDKNFSLFSGPTPCAIPNCYCSFSWLCDDSKILRQEATQFMNE